MKILADDDLDALLSVVGVGAGARQRDRELPGSKRTVDLLAECPDGSLVHVEFVKDAAPELDLRMVEYRVRLRRRHPDVPIRQVVLVLADVVVPDRYADDGMRCSWQVVRLGELDARALLAQPTTAALAVLGSTETPDRSAVLTAAAAVIAESTVADRRAVLLGAAATLASIVLPGATIDTALREATMPVPIRELPYARMLIEEGREEGREETALAITSAILRRRFGDDPRVPAVAERLADLPVDECVARVIGATTLDELEG